MHLKWYKLNIYSIVYNKILLLGKKDIGQVKRI